MDYLKKKCPDFALDSSKMPRNANYLHHSIQDELLEISTTLALEVIRDKVQMSPCFAIMADETRDISGSEQLSVFLRYTRGADVIERFIEFLHLEEFNAEAISRGMLELLCRTGVDVSKCIGQSYDGASVMAGKASGVQSRFQNLVAGYCPCVHCHNHRLNLALMDSCTAITEVRELVGLLHSIYMFQCNSARRAQYFEASQRQLDREVLKMPQSCDSRWYSKKKGVHYFKTRPESTILALDNIVQDGRGDKVVHCRGYLRELRSFKTAMLLVILDEVLGEVNCLSEYLQCPDLIFTRAVKLSRAVLSTL